MTKEIQKEKSVPSTSPSKVSKELKETLMEMEHDLVIHMPPKNRYTLEVEVVSRKKAKPNIRISDYDLILDLDDEI